MWAGVTWKKTPFLFHLREWKIDCHCQWQIAAFWCLFCLYRIVHSKNALSFRNNDLQKDEHVYFQQFCHQLLCKSFKRHAETVEYTRKWLLIDSLFYLLHKVFIPLNALCLLKDFQKSYYMQSVRKQFRLLLRINHSQNRQIASCHTKDQFFVVEMQAPNCILSVALHRK